MRLSTSLRIVLFGTGLAFASCRLGYERLDEEPTPFGQQVDVPLGGDAGAPPSATGGESSMPLGGQGPVGRSSGGASELASAGGSGGNTNAGGAEAVGGALASGGSSVGGGGAGGSAVGGSAVGGSGAGGSSTVVVAPFTQLSAGEYHTCGIASSQNIYCWGLGDNDALGGFVGAQSSNPQSVSGEGSLGAFVGLSAGNACACGVKEDGELWCWGRNFYGTLGQGDTADSPTPQLVPFPKAVRTVSLNFEVACAIDIDGDLWCWGENTEGQLGQNDTFEAPVVALSPILVPLSGPWARVSTGQGHVCAIRETGELYCWGRNSNGELGRATPVQLRVPTQVGSDSDWAYVNAGQFQTCGIRNDGSLWCFGADDGGQLGLDTSAAVLTPTRVGTENDWTQVEVDVLHACGLRGGGALYCWGRRDEGQLALAYDPTPQRTPLAIDAGQLWREITVGRFYTCGVLDDGTRRCTGENNDGQLGDSTTTRPYAFVDVLPF